MNPLYRALMALATVIPLSIPLGYIYINNVFFNVYAEKEWFVTLSFGLSKQYFIIIMMVLILIMNIIIGFLMVYFLDFVAKDIGKEPVRVESIKLLGGDSLMGYLPYVLPLFITENTMQGIMGWAIGIVALYLLAWSSATIAFSPLLRICGLRFFEATLSDNTTVTLLIRNKEIQPLKLKSAAWISEFCIYGLR